MVSNLFARCAPGDGAMEKILTSHVVLWWLRLTMIERQYTNVMNQSISSCPRSNHCQLRRC
jgi:hypothetical protein